MYAAPTMHAPESPPANWLRSGTAGARRHTVSNADSVSTTPVATGRLLRCGDKLLQFIVQFSDCSCLLLVCYLLPCLVCPAGLVSVSVRPER